jgi:hypothetical protein
MHVLTVICDGGWMPIHLSEGWRRAGWVVHEFPYGTHMGKDWSAVGLRENADTNARLLRIARELKAAGQLDLIFAVIYDDVLRVDTARELRALGVPMVNYHVDLVGQWYRVLRTGRYFDRMACAQDAHWSSLRRAGIRPYLMPMAANPLRQEPMESAVSEWFDGVVYMGSPWPYRRQVLEALASEGIALRVYGNNWLVRPGAPRIAGRAQPVRKALHDVWHYLGPRLRAEGIRPLMNSLGRRLSPRSAPETERTLRPFLQGAYEAAAFPGLVRRAGINLGFTHFSGPPGTRHEARQMRLRDFEIPMMGGFYLAQRCAEISSMFEEDRHLACWDGVDDLVQKIRYYLSRPDLRRTIGEAGRLHCERHHTWETRFRGLLGEIGLSAPQTRSPAEQKA